MLDSEKIINEVSELYETVRDCHYWLGEYKDDPENFQRVLTQLNSAMFDYLLFAGCFRQVKAK